MTKTENLGLSLAEGGEGYNVDLLNGNTKLLDTAIQSEVSARCEDIGSAEAMIGTEADERRAGDVECRKVENKYNVLAVKNGGMGGTSAKSFIQSKLSALPVKRLADISGEKNVVLMLKNGSESIPAYAGLAAFWGISGGYGLGIGCITAFYGQVCPKGWLPCDGRYISSQYKKLRSVLGGYYTPDLRELVPMGAGRNTTDAIATHFVLSATEFADDCMQTHTHTVKNVTISDDSKSESGQSSLGYVSKTIKTFNMKTGRWGNVTMGKRKGVMYIIRCDIV